MTICIAGIKPLLTKQTMVAVYALVFFIADILFYALWHDWHGGWCFGPRLIVPVLIVAHVFLPEAVKNIHISIVNKLLFAIILVCALAINCLGSLVCYQEMYYFHTDYTSVSQSHPVIEARLLAHKLAGKPEYYSLADMNVSRMQTVYRNTWPTLIKGNAIDLTSFKTFRGLATMWCGLSENFGWTWALFVPVFLFGATMFCLQRVRFIFQEKPPNITTHIF